MKNLNIIDLNSFDSKVINAKDKLVLVMFSAPWCSICKMMIPQIEKVQDDILEDNIADIYIFEISDTDDDDIIEKYNILNLPTIIIFKNGIEEYRSIGAISKNKIIENIKRLH